MPVIPPGNNIMVCSICGLPFTEFGNNAQPVNTGRCCNLCNDLYVIPRKVHAMRQAKEADDAQSKNLADDA